MPTLSFSSDGPLTANVHIPGPTVREVAVTERSDGQVEVAIGGVDLGVRLVGPIDVLHALVIEADGLLMRLRGAASRPISRERL